MSKAPIDALLDSLALQPAKPDQDREIVAGLPYATHEAVFDLGGFPMKVYMLNTGERVIDADDVREFFGGEWKPSTE